MPERLDAALAARGLARSRTHAQQLISAGEVWLNEVNVTKASTPVHESDEVRVAALDHYVSRAAHKLIAALDEFGVDPSGRLALDAGASTGGFTQVLLERGALRVIALDVGRGQLAPRVRSDERVCVVEGENIRGLTAKRLAELSGSDELPSLVVADLSFISLELVLPALRAGASADADFVLPALRAGASADADFVLLIKPQFEVGRGGVREGVVRDANARAEAVERVLWSAHDIGLQTAGLARSPLVGSHGNIEVLCWLSPTTGQTPTEWSARIQEVAR
ncbi:MAG: TlyA family RNA methyltransferase [Microbacteriaceae bacterium]